MPTPAAETCRNPSAELTEFIESNQPLVVLTGAGCSTDSGIPDYRDENGNWKYRQPVNYMDYIRDVKVRQHYWSRSMLGWPRIARARPNPAHTALARLERAGYIRYLVTQNVDGLHQKAGSKSILELHGGLHWVVCLDCRKRLSRSRFQELLLEYNPQFDTTAEVFAPDGDAILAEIDSSAFRVPACSDCHGMLKPDVVFFGETVPRDRIDRVLQELDQARALLVVGSSLMVFSGYRFCKYTREQGKAVAALNLGRTRADKDLSLKVDLPCHIVLPEITARLP